MKGDGNYPMGAEYDHRAPYNQETKKITVTVSVTMSTTVDIEVPADYEAFDCEGKDLKDFVEEQITLPFEKFRDWCIDDYTVIEE